MRLEVTYRSLQGKPEIRRRAEALFKKLHRFLDPAAEGKLMLAADHGRVVSELVVSAYGHVFKCIEEDDELRSALDATFHTMEGQLRRAKDRRTEHRGAAEDQAESETSSAPESEEYERPLL